MVVVVGGGWGSAMTSESTGNRTCTCTFPARCGCADIDLKKLPRRRTDGAYVVDTTEHTVKLYTEDGGVRLVKR